MKLSAMLSSAAAWAAAFYMIAAGTYSLAALHLGTPESPPLSSILEYVSEKNAHASFYVANGALVVAGVCLLSRRLWSVLLSLAVLAHSTYFSAYGVAWTIEGHDAPVDLLFFLILFGIWNSFWALLMVLGRKRERRAD